MDDAGLIEYRTRDKEWHKNKRDSHPELRIKEKAYSKAYYAQNKDRILEKKKLHNKKKIII